MDILWNDSYPGIYINDSAGSTTGVGSRPLGMGEGFAFVSATRVALTKIAAKPVGGDLLSLISKRCQGVGTKLRNGRCTIYYGTGTLTEGQIDPTKALLGQTNNTAVDNVGRNRTRDAIRSAGAIIPNVYKAGVGSSAMVSYNPFINWDTVIVGGRPISTIIGVDTPAYIGLAHELVHALHTLSGDRNPDRPGGKAPTEEARTVGAGKYANTRISENTIRSENGVELRQWYARPGDCG